MSQGIVEAVPNFSEGRDLEVVRELVRTIERTGAEVLDWSADPDHNRSVITLVGRPATVQEALVEAAHHALERIDLSLHEGVHPRIGALDVLPIVPLAGLDLDDAREIAHALGRRIADEVGIPVYFYAEASEPRGRRLSELRRGGFEALIDGWPKGREPDLLPTGWDRPGAHPTAGATSVGARPLLLAWNINLNGVDIATARAIAAEIRESGGGFLGLRALALELESKGLTQISMNLEDLSKTSPFEVFQRVEDDVIAAGGAVVETEVIGMIPDELILPAAGARLRLAGDDTGRRLLSRRLVEYIVSVDLGGDDPGARL